MVVWQIESGMLRLPTRPSVSWILLPTISQNIVGFVRHNQYSMRTFLCDRNVLDIVLVCVLDIILVGGGYWQKSEFV